MKIQTVSLTLGALALGALALAASPPAGAVADPVSARDLVSDCKGAGALGRERQLACSGFLLGVIQASYIEDQYNDAAKQPAGFCLTDSVTPREVRRRFLEWAEDHPSELGRERLAVAIMAMRESFPC